MKYSLASILVVLCIAILSNSLLSPPCSATDSWSDPEYEAKTASEKLDIMMNLMEETRGSQGRFPTLFERLKFLLWDNFEHSVARYSDLLPYTHGKRIRSVGGVCSAAFIAARNGSHPFTGIFKTGNPHLLLRLSLTSKPDETTTAPGIAVKFFRDYIPSANFLAMYTLEGQVGSGNFFKHNFSNHLAKSSEFILSLVSAKFGRYSSPSEMVGVSDIAAYEGTTRVPDAEIQFPYQVVMKPNPVLTEQFKDAKPLDSLEEMLSEIPVGTTLYDLYGSTEPEFISKDAKMLFIGSIKTTSDIFYSKNGDNKLFFRHQKMQDDFDLRPKWRLPTTKSLKAKCPFSK